MKMKKIPHKKIIILMLIIIILIPFCLFQNKHLVITTYTYESEKLGADLDGYRIVQISDLHNAEFGKENKKLLETIRSCSPDIIVITGDLVDSNHTNVERAVAFVKEAVKIAPVYYVTGNHEYWLEPSENEQMMQGIGPYHQNCDHRDHKQPYSLFRHLLPSLNKNQCNTETKNRHHGTHGVGTSVPEHERQCIIPGSQLHSQ